MSTPFVPECKECGAEMIATSDEFVCCPNGHGKLHPRCRNFLLLMRERRKAIWLASLPEARYTGKRLSQRRVFTIKGYDGHFLLAPGRSTGKAKLETNNIATLYGKPRRFVPVDERE